MARHKKTSSYDRGWPAYVPVAERRKKAEQEVRKRLAKGQSISPVTLDGRAIVTTFWFTAPVVSVACTTNTSVSTAVDVTVN